MAWIRIHESSQSMGWHVVGCRNRAGTGSAFRAGATENRHPGPHGPCAGLRYRGGRGELPKGYFNTPESDGRPGVYYFELGARAARKHDFVHAISMYKVAASWAYKPAEYNLGLMYFNGHGVPVDRPLGAAWMVLAAERHNTKYYALYTRARDLMISSLSKAEFAQTDKLWGRLKQTYGDKFALRRAKSQRLFAGGMETGSHLGRGVGDLQIGAPGAGDKAPGTSTTGDTLLSGGSAAGFAYYGYGQFSQSYNPYDPVFLKNRTGTVAVEPLTPVKR